MTPPLVTIGITCHNAADTIRRAIGSALAQDWPAFDVLIVDDGSTDDSVTTINAAIAGDPRARLVRHERNLGVAAARNTIVGHARGEFITFFDDDDESIPDRVRAQWERIVSYERLTGASLTFCYSDRNVVEHGASRLGHESLGIGRTRPEPHGQAVADFLLSIDADPHYVWGQCGSCTLMARREAFLAVGAFDASFRRCAELDLAVRAAFMGAHFIAVDRPLITQFKTASPDKANREPLKYQLQLRAKHRTYLTSRNFYAPSRALARADFYGFRSRFWTSRAWRLLACALSPRLLRSELRRRVGGVPDVVGSRRAGT